MSALMPFVIGAVWFAAGYSCRRSGENKRDGAR
jgi:hypothetical protein